MCGYGVVSVKSTRASVVAILHIHMELVYLESTIYKKKYWCF